MDRALLLNTVTVGGAGLAAVLVPSRVGWWVYRNEGSSCCKYFQLHTRVLGMSAIAFAIINYIHARGQTPRLLKATIAQLMLGLTASIAILAGVNFAMFSPVVGLGVIGTNVVLAGLNGYYGFLKRIEQ